MPSLRRAAGRVAGRERPRPIRVGAPLALLDVLRDGPAPLADGARERVDAAGLHVAVVVPPFRRGSGGHQTIANLVRGLEALGDRVSMWLEDPEERHAGEGADELAAHFAHFFGPTQEGLRPGFDGWRGADVVMATGWQTVPRALTLDGALARAYLVQDHEPEFYATSAEREWAEWTYRQGLHCVCASPWLADLVSERYSASATPFDLGVAHGHYRALPTHRREDLVLFYARAVTARRAVPLGILALAELHRRRPELDIALFGESREVQVPFPARQLGVLPPDELAEVYGYATVGMCLSLTNPSLIPTEMLACGLTVVDVASEAMTATFGPGSPGAGTVLLAEPDPLALCDAVQHLLDDLVDRADRSRAGIELVAERRWPSAAAQVREGLRAALEAAAGA